MASWRLLQRRISKAQQDSTPDFSHLQPILSPFIHPAPDPAESPLNIPRPMDALQYSPEPFTYYSPYEHHHSLEPLNVRDLATVAFDSSSSSLSSALDESLAVSRRPRLQQTLPTIVEHIHDRVDQQTIWTSPLGLENTPELVQDQFDEHEFHFSPELIMSAEVQDNGLLPQDDRYRYRDHDIFSASPMMTSLLQLSPTNPTQSAKSYYMELDFDQSPASSVASWDFYPSSASSTPFGLGLQTTLSPTESPNPVSPLDLPNQLQESGNSLLFSPAGVPRIAPSRRNRKLPLRKNRPTIKVTSSARLSSMLPLSNECVIMIITSTSSHQSLPAQQCAHTPVGMTSANPQIFLTPRRAISPTTGKTNTAASAKARQNPSNVLSKVVERLGRSVLFSAF